MATYADRNFSYNPFVNNEVMRDDFGGIRFYKDPQTGQWFEKQTVGGMGDNQTSDQWVPVDAPATQYQTSAGDREVTANYTPGREVGVNWAELEKNDPALAKAWGQNSPGFLRDSTGFNHFKVIDFDPQTGAYTTMTKTGDKEGTVEQWGQKPDGSWGVIKTLGTQEWDTNLDVTQQGSFNVAKVAAAPLMAYGANELAQAAGFSGLAPNAGGMPFPEGVGEAVSFGSQYGSGLINNAPSLLSQSGQSGKFLNDLLQQSTPIEASMSAAQSSAPQFFSAATQQSLPVIGAFSGLAPQFPVPIDPLFQGLSDTPIPPAAPPPAGDPAPPNSGPADPNNPATKPGTNAATPGPLDELFKQYPWLKAIAPFLGAVGSYFDAASNNGERNGYQPSTDMLTAHMNKSPMQNRQQFSDLVNRGPQNITPQYTTSLAGGQPQFSTGLLPIPPVGQRTGYQHPQLAQSGLLLNNPFRRPIG
jgi:hypothetical protein